MTQWSLQQCCSSSYRRGVLDTTLCDKVRQSLTTGWFSPGASVSINLNLLDDEKWIIPLTLLKYTLLIQTYENQDERTH